MKATSRIRGTAGAFCLLLCLSALSFGQEYRLELDAPDFDLFTPTDWIDAASFTLKERIPAGITGYIHTPQPMDVWLQGVVYKQTASDPRPVRLASFWVSRSRPIKVEQQSGGGDYVYALQIGALSGGTDFGTEYREETAEVDKLEEQIQSGISALTGKFTVEVFMTTFFQDNVSGAGAVARFEKVFDIPFSSPDQAKIQVQIDPVVSTPNPTIIVFLPPERPNLEYEIAVYRMQDNAQDAVQNGIPLWREVVRDGRTLLTYPVTATPLTSGERYVVAGASFYQSSSSREKLSIEADLVEFTYEDPATGGASQAAGESTQSSPGQSATRPDPLLSIFGPAATQLPPLLSQNLTRVLRELQTRGWTFSSFRYNNRRITKAELVNLISQFENATISVVE